MNALELARKALETVDDFCFDCRIYASEGGKCGGGWCDSTELELNSSQLLYLISQRVDKPKLFEGKDLEEIDLDSTILDLAYCGAFPQGDPYASAYTNVPQELAALGEELARYDDSDAAAATSIMEQLKAIQDGEYTFTFSINDAVTDEPFEEGVVRKINLSAEEARGLLKLEYGHDQLFEGLSCENVNKRLVDDKAAKLGFAEDFNNYSCGGDCEPLEYYLEAWWNSLTRYLTERSQKHS